MNSEPNSAGPTRGRAGGFGEVYRTWRYLFWLIGAVALVFLFYGEEDWRGERAWRHYRQRMAARGQAVEPSPFIPPPVPDDQNFAMTPSLAPLFEFLPGTQKWRDPEVPQLFQDLMSRYNEAADRIRPRPAQRANSWVHVRTDLNLWAAAFNPPPRNKVHGRQPLIPTNFTDREAADAVVGALSDFTPVLDELREASTRPYSRFNLRYEQENPATILLPHLAKIKGFCQVLQLRASAELAQGRTDQAFRDVTLILQLTDTTRTEPILISQLVRMAEVQLAFQPLAEGMGRWSDTQLRQLQQRLAAFDFLGDAERCLEGERVLFGGGVIDYFRRSHHKLRVIGEFEGVGPPGQQNDFWPVGALFAAGPEGWLSLEQLKYNQTFDRYLLPIVDVTNRLVHPDRVLEADSALSKITDATPLKRFFHHQFFSALLLPSLAKISQKTAFAQTGVDTASIACALERCRVARGRFPDSLADLVPAFLPALPHDVISGKPLGYRLQPDGHYVVYSVGWNGTDDGGMVEHNKSGEPDPKEGDWAWTDNP